MPAPSLVDFEQLACLTQLCEGGQARQVEELYDLFVRDTCLSVVDLACAVLEGRLSVVAAEGHRLRGAMYAFGARRLAECCAELERAASRASVEEIVGALSELGRTTRATLVEIGDALRPGR